MKKFFIFLSFIIVGISAIGQTPQFFNYQAVLRNNTGGILANQTVNIKVSIRDINPSGTIVFQETHTGITTNNFGVIIIKIGNGTPGTGTIAGVAWATGNKYVEIEMDYPVGSGYVSTGTQQLLSVPYALYAANANVPGVAGPTGPTGAAGIAGATGVTGQQGITGMQGPTGPSGANGNIGATGPQGPTGIGLQGPTGTQGTTGVQGPTGPTSGWLWQVVGNGIQAVNNQDVYVNNSGSTVGFCSYLNNTSVGPGWGSGTPGAEKSGITGWSNGYGFQTGVYGYSEGVNDDEGGIVGAWGPSIWAGLGYRKHSIPFGAYISGLLGFAAGSYHTAFIAGTQTANLTYTLPTSQGAAGSVLANNGAGLLSWSSTISNADMLDNLHASSFMLLPSGTNNFITKFTSATTIGNSQIQDNGTNVGVGAAPSLAYKLYVYFLSLTANGDGQSSIYGYRTRDSQNDGSDYSQTTCNKATSGFNFWGDLYTFGVAGHNYNDYNRCGGVLGSEVSGTYWGSLGYRSSGLLNYGGYFTSTANGTGFLSSTNAVGIGSASYGDLFGSWSRGEIFGSASSGEVFASYNLGNEYTSGFQADLVNTGTSKTAAYSVTSTSLKVYDNGTSQINNGTGRVDFTKEFGSLISGNPTVTVSPTGDCMGLYVTNIDSKGFTVKELQGGNSNVSFTWIVVGQRIDAKENNQVSPIVTDFSFDSNLRNLMFNENNKERNGGSLWWDGNKIRTDRAPENKFINKKELEIQGSKK
jgi:hypothetical protein